MGLNEEPRAAAVGVKGYGAPSPTQCSKLKIYRPKTTGNLNRRDSRDNNRPKTSQPKRVEHMSEIELALCWDFKPIDPKDEPKRSPHIDGSNGSAAPAVFGLVHHPSPLPSDDEQHTPCFSLEQTKAEKRLSVDSLRSVSKSSADRAKIRPKTAWGSDSGKEKQLKDSLKKLQERSNPSAVMDIINNNSKENNSPNIRPDSTRTRAADSKPSRRKSLSGHNSSKSSDLDSQTFSKQKHYQSSPNLTTVGVQTNHTNGKNRLLNSRPCMACEQKKSPTGSIQEDKPPKVEYKMAFKAGKPKNGSANGSLNSSQEGSSILSKQHSCKQVQVPKLKTPYAKKNYAIGTLAPPFSLWPGTTGQDYPEHWRLASVYQHSYKPVELRRKPLLQSIYQ